MSAIGALAGATLGARRGLRSVTGGALIGAAGLGVIEAVARARQKPGQIPARWARIAASGALAAPAGWLGGRLTGAGPVAVGAVSGTVAGGLGLRPQKVALGPVVGASLGAGFAAFDRKANPALVAAATVTAFRVLSTVAFPDEQISMLAERVSPEQLPFVLPLAAHSRYIGEDSEQPGHYLTYINRGNGELTSAAVRGFAEQLDVIRARRRVGRRARLPGFRAAVPGAALPNRAQAGRLTCDYGRTPGNV